MEKEPKNLVKGMSTDNNQEFQPEGTYRYALNAVTESDVGERGAISNEIGNSECFELDKLDNGVVTGSCLLSNGNNIVFATNNNISIIGIQYPDCTFKELIRTDCLQFDRCRMIDAEFKVHNGCNYIIYFTDEVNKYRSIDISNLNKYVLPGYDAYNNTTNGGVLADPNLPPYGWNCGMFNVSPDYQVPDVYLKNIKPGGNLRIGTYYISIRYMDGNFNPVNWIAPFGPIYINKEQTSNTSVYNNNGLLGGNQDGYYYTNKSIELEFTNVDVSYKYFQVAIIEATQGTDSFNLVHVSQNYSITGSSFTYTIDEITTSKGYVASSLSAITVPYKNINVVKAHTQVDNRLVIAGLKGQVADWSVFQKAANDIQTQYFTYEGDEIKDLNDDCEYFTSVENSIIDSLPNSSLNHSNTRMLFDNKTYMRDEIYALGIVYIFKDGLESPVFHIPGRVKIGTPTDAFDTSTTTQLNVDGQNYTSSFGEAYWSTLNNGDPDLYNISPVLNEWDTKPYNIASKYPLNYYDTSSLYSDFNNSFVPEAEDIYSNSTCAINNIYRWQHVNTSIAGANPSTYNKFITFKHRFKVKEIGLCAYFETDTFYPEVKDCNGVPIYPHDVLANGTYRMHKIRHHRMPDARKVPIMYTTSGPNTRTNILPLGVLFHNINVPDDYKDIVQGYYIVRGDRAGNKTVIDKGWLNVSDVTWGYEKGATYPATPSFDLNENVKTIEQNTCLMVPTAKIGMNPSLMGSSDIHKQPYLSGYNVVEFFSPKVSFNEITNIGADYFKLENTAYGTMYYKNMGKNSIDSYSASDTSDFNDFLVPEEEGFRMMSAVYLHKYTHPRIFNFNDRLGYNLAYNIPISESEYTLYNQDNICSLAPEFTLKNLYHRQNMFMARVFKYNNLSANEADIYYLNKPVDTAVLNGSGLITAGKADLISFKTRLNNISPSIDANTADPGDYDIYYWINTSKSGTVGYVGRAFKSLTTPLYSQFLYYVSIKRNIIPYRKLEDIKYIKATNYIIENIPFVYDVSYAISGGDCFITRQQLYKSYFKNTGTAGSTGLNEDKESGTLIVGYVESEINAYFRHKELGEDKYVYPFDTMKDMLRVQTDELKAELREDIEHFYRYRLDFSSDNRTRMYFPLPDAFDYCSECVDNFPHTMYYSGLSLPDQQNDNYRLFEENSSGEISSDSGKIIDLFVKEMSLFIHTEGSLWRMNLSPQELQTTNDTLQIGQGTLFTAKPVKMFDNQQGFARGGIEFKFSGRFCDDKYLWVDSSSRRIYMLDSGFKEISEIGMKRWFKENLTLYAREQFKSLSKYDYPYLNTACERSIGFVACFDPKYNRYIVSKKDYKVHDSIMQQMQELPTDPLLLVPNSYYYDKNGWYFYDGNGLILTYLDLDNPLIAEVKGWTASFSLTDLSWTSFHSYRPNYLFNNNETFFSYASNLNFNRTIWTHNKGNYQTYYGEKQDFIFDYINVNNPYVDSTYDNIEYASNVFKYNPAKLNWIEEQFITFDRFYVYNNNQVSNLKTLTVKNLTSYYDTQNYSVLNSSVHKDRNIWKINRVRDMSVDRDLNVNSMFSSDWNDANYRNLFFPNLGSIDHVLNAAYININKNVYQQERFTDKYLGVRLFFKPQDDLKIVTNVFSNLKRNRI